MDAAHHTASAASGRTASQPRGTPTVSSSTAIATSAPGSEPEDRTVARAAAEEQRETGQEEAVRRPASPRPTMNREATIRPRLHSPRTQKPYSAVVGSPGIVGRSMKLRILIGVGIAALALAAAVARPLPAAAATPCWKALLNDWYDGRIDNTYPLHCYSDALTHLPADVQTYSSAHDDILRALQNAKAELRRNGTKVTPNTPVPSRREAADEDDRPGRRPRTRPRRRLAPPGGSHREAACRAPSTR